MRWPFSSSTRPPNGAALYAAIVAEARRPDWYLAGQVPDTIDGRFAVLASLLALADIRLGQGGEAARELAPRLAECFIADMDAQMREAGFGDPGLGKQVRMMVGSLASRVERWRGVIKQGQDAQGANWREAVVASVYRDEAADGEAVDSAETRIRDYWRRLQASGEEGLAEGAIG